MDFKNMKVGESVVIEGETTKGSIARQVRKLAKFSTTRLGFMIRTVPGGIQIWRIR